MQIRRYIFVLPDILPKQRIMGQSLDLFPESLKAGASHCVTKSNVEQVYVPTKNWIHLHCDCALLNLRFALG